MMCYIYLFIVHFKESEMETEEEVDILMSSDVYSATLSTKSITFSRAQTGWLFREDKTVGVICQFLETLLWLWTFRDF